MHPRWQFFQPVSSQKFLRNDKPTRETVDPLPGYRLTYTTLLNLFRQGSEYVKYLYHDLHNRVCHPCGRRNFNIDLQPPKDILDAVEQVKESASTSADSVCGLREWDITMAS